jgi:hypothetical protein
MLLSSKQKARKGLNYLEEAILEVLKKVSPRDISPAEITQQLDIDPLVTSTSARYSSIADIYQSYGYSTNGVA